MRYELHMQAAIAEAAAARAVGEQADGAVAVLGEAMVARGHCQVDSTGDPTAHAVMVALREAARRLGMSSLSGLTVFAVVEPCAMCVGALLQSDADGLVYALADPAEGACGSAIQVADSTGLSRHLRIVSGILQAEAAELRPDLVGVRAEARAGLGRGVTYR